MSMYCWRHPPSIPIRHRGPLAAYPDDETSGRPFEVGCRRLGCALGVVPSKCLYLLDIGVISELHSGPTVSCSIFFFDWSVPAGASLGMCGPGWFLSLRTS